MITGAFWAGKPPLRSGFPAQNQQLAVAAGETVLVDNKVCAIDDAWSGLRLVVRKEARAAWPVPASTTR